MNAKTHYLHCNRKHKLVETLLRNDQAQEDVYLPKEIAEKEVIHARLVQAIKRERQ